MESGHNRRTSGASEGASEAISLLPRQAAGTDFPIDWKIRLKFRLSTEMNIRWGAFDERAGTQLRPYNS